MGKESFLLRVSFMFSPDETNFRLKDTLWGDVPDENIFGNIRNSSEYEYVKNHIIKSIDIRIDQT